MIETLSQLEVPAPPQPGMQGHDPNFATLARLLHQSNYKLPLPAEGALLAYRLFADLVQVSKSAQTYKELSETQAAELENLQKQLYPLRRENARLVRANNAIHMQAMKV